MHHQILIVAMERFKVLVHKDQSAKCSLTIKCSLFIVIEHSFICDQICLNCPYGHTDKDTTCTNI